jgi:transcriptional regulator of acetoin/glycerol metabolism
MLQDLGPRLQNWKKISLQKTTQGDIYEALQACNGNRRAAALRLGISERTVYRYLNLFGE